MFTTPPQPGGAPTQVDLQIDETPDIPAPAQPLALDESALRPFVRRLWGIPFCFRTVAASMAAVRNARDSLGALVLQDPVLLAHLICRAHSRDEVYEFFSIGDSLARLGDENISCFLKKASTVYTRKFFPHGFLPAFRLYSTKVAALAAYMAREMASTSKKKAEHAQRAQDLAFVAGSLHAIGELFMLANQPAKMGGNLLSRERFYSLDRRSILLSNPDIRISYEQAGSVILQRLGAPAQIASLVAQHAIPFEESDHDPLIAILALAVWRVRAAELGYESRKLVTTFPDTPAIAAGIDFDALNRSATVNRILDSISAAGAISALRDASDSIYQTTPQKHGRNLPPIPVAGDTARTLHIT